MNSLFDALHDLLQFVHGVAAGYVESNACGVADGVGDGVAD